MSSQQESGMYAFPCPFCGADLQDDEVHFRSVRVSGEGNYPAGIAIFQTLDDFEWEYHGVDKDARRAELEEWFFFQPEPDDVYSAFWERYRRNRAVHRDSQDGSRMPGRILDPAEPEVRRFLKAQANGSYLIRADGMVAGVELRTGERCWERVCPHCHNPLSNGYGRYPICIMPVLGIAGVGKSAFVSELLSNLRSYLGRLGLRVSIPDAGVSEYLEGNRSASTLSSSPSRTLDGPSPVVMHIGNSVGLSATLVILDVAGEALSLDMLGWAAPSLKRTGALLMLVSPEQIERVARNLQRPRARPVGEVLEEVRRAFEAWGFERLDFPVAVCLTKVDESVASLIGPAVSRRCRESASAAAKKGEFDAERHNPVAKEMHGWLAMEAPAVVIRLGEMCTDYSLFAVNAAEERARGGAQDIDEPFYWLLYRRGLLDANADSWTAVEREQCPECGSEKVAHEDHSYEERVSLLRSTTIHVNRRCLDCEHRWASEEL